MPFTYAQTLTEEEIYEAAFKPSAVIEWARMMLPNLWKAEILSGVGHGMIVECPPVRVEWILESPPSIYFDVCGRFVRVSNMFPEIHDAQSREALRSAGLVEFPLELHRFVIAREVLSIAAASEQGRLMGLPELLVENHQECQDYFARVLLVFDRLIVRYRSKGGDFRGFAGSFLIPPPIAEIRWNDPILLEG